MSALNPEISIPLDQLINSLPGSHPASPKDLLITGVFHDSRVVQPGGLFVALVGGSVDGHRFIPTAIDRGAAAVVGMQPLSGLPVPYYQVDDSRLALALLAAAFYGNPARDMLVIGVTGTDGKTTTSSLIYSILKAAGLQSGLVSSVSAAIGDREMDTGFHVTTPEAPDIQRYLAEMKASGATHAVLETTSHGLAQQRVAACDFDLGVVTNITHEHLDYHGSYEGYRQAKGRLFTGLAETPEKKNGNFRIAILNRDDFSYEYLSAIIEETNERISDHSRLIRTITYGFHEEAQVRAEEATEGVAGLRFTAVGPDFRLPLESPLVGRFNILNCLAAATTAIAGLGLPPEAIQQGIANLRGIPGRMERIHLGQDFTAIVDFAHTPNALRRALGAARELAAESPGGPGRVIAVFGSAGLRDREKRGMMAETSAELADLTVLTAEDPRTEDLDQILEEMAEGARRAGGVEGKTFWRVGDRGEALRFAVRLAQPGDVLLSCGKGHEQSMCFGVIEYPWDDRIALRSALSEHLGIPGPEMPYLPTSSKA